MSPENSSWLAENIEGQMKSLTLSSYSRKLESHLSPENSKWLAENVGGVDDSVKEILRLIEDEYSAVKEAEVCHHQKPELTAHVTKIRHMHKLLAERYDQLTEDVRMEIPSLFDVQHSGNHDSDTQPASPLQIPDQKLTRARSEHDGDFKLYPSSGSGSPDSSLKEGSEYSTSSDSDSESYYSTINKDIVSPTSVKSKVPHSKYVEKTELQGTEVMVQKIKEENVDGTAAKVRDFKSYDLLLKRLTECEEELIITNEKLQFSEEENGRLEGELKKKESVTVLVDNLNGQLDAAQQSIKMRNANFETENGKVLELQNQVVGLQSQIGDYRRNIELLMQELKMYRKKLEDSEKELVKLKHDPCNEVSEGTCQFHSQLESAHKEIALLEAKLRSEKDQVAELQEKVSGYVADISHHDQEIIALNATISNAHTIFSGEKELLQSDLSGLLQENRKLNGRIEEIETQIRSLQIEIYRCKSEKMDRQALFDAQLIKLQVEIGKITATKDHLVEVVNKELDGLKLSCEMLVAELEVLNANVENQNAELSSKNNEIQEMNNRIYHLNWEKVQMIAESERSKKHAEELKEKVMELQNEVDMQVAVISNRAEEKREAIRQLCFTIEHYRNGYQELRRASTAIKHRSVLD